MGNKLKKISLIIIAFMFVFVIGNKDVFAVPTCTYYQTFVECKDCQASRTQEKRITVSYDNGKLKGECKNKNSDEQELVVCKLNSNISSLFVIENGKLYCPSSIYLNLDSASSRKYSLSGTKRTEPVTGYYSNAINYPSYTLNLNQDNITKDVKGGAYTYTPSSGENKFSACKTGGSLQQADIDNKINNYTEEIKKYDENTTNETVKTMESNVKELTNGVLQYCYFQSNTDYVVKLQTLSNSLSSKVQSLDGIDEATRNSIIRTTSEISNKVMSNIALAERYDLNNPELDCNDVIDENLKAVIQLVLKWIRIGAPILLVLLIAIDFSQVVISNDQDAIKKAITKAIKRAIAALALFFVPLFVSLMLDWVNDSDYFNKDKIKCEEIYK